MERTSVEEGLLLKQGKENEEGRLTWRVICQEMKKLGYLAGPMVAVTSSQYLIQVISIMMVGHLGELSLSSTAIAISIATVTGSSFLLGMACALETLCGQAYGAQQYQKIGTQTYTAIFCLIIVCIPLSILWVYMGRILIFLGQDPLISREAGKFITWLVPALFAYAALQPLVRYFQMQTMILPMLISSCCTIFFHIPVCWVLVFKLGLNNLGAAVAMDLSLWLNVLILGLYMKYSPSCEKTRAPISMEIFRGIKEFFRFAIPSAVMICLNTIATLYSIPYGLAAAVSTRVSNELGAGNSDRARISVVAVMLLAITEIIIVNSALFASRHVFGYIFSNEKEVVDYVTDMAPLLCLSVIMDSLQGTLSGIARGCGWQHIGAYVNLAAFYLCGIPIAATLGFWVKLRGRGLWIGVLCGAALQTILLSIITSCTNWEKQAIKARHRLIGEKPHVIVA